MPAQRKARMTALFGLIFIVGASTVSAREAVGLKVRESTQWGPVIVDQDERSLYVFTVNDEGNSIGACDEKCLESWPPLLSSGKLKIGPDVERGRVSSVSRPDGHQQVTYDGWPLFHYLADDDDTDMLGQNKRDNGGLWHLIAPDGHVLNDSYNATPSPDAED